jgi:hypothetical protein
MGTGQRRLGRLLVDLRRHNLCRRACWRYRPSKSATKYYQYVNVCHTIGITIIEAFT